MFELLVGALALAAVLVVSYWTGLIIDRLVTPGGSSLGRFLLTLFGFCLWFALFFLWNVLPVLGQI